METDSEDESEKTFADLTNVNLEPSSVNYQLQFEQFVVAEKSDDESDVEDQEDSDQYDEDDEQEVKPLPSEDLLHDLDISLSSQECTLKSEEIAIIENCHNAELKNLLLMNRSKNFMLMQLFKKVKDLLLDCRNDIESLTRLSQQSESIDNQGMFLSHLAAPYFKTKKEMFSSNPNADTIARKKNGELSVYQNVMSPKWSRNECDNLISAVKLTYNHNKQKSLLRKIAVLKCKLEKVNSSVSEETDEDIQNLEEERKKVEEIGPRDIPPLGQDDFIDWVHISSEYFNGKHTSLECRAFWHIYLHPEINKSNWMAEENIKIKELARKHHHQDWDQVALKLGTKRSGFSVCLHFLSVLCEQGSRVRFTKEEDDLILYHVEKMRIGSYIPWNAIESYFPHRLRNQLMHRYKYFLKSTDHVQSVFTDVEDILILILVDRYGRNYSKFAHYLPQRSYMQIKNRYDVHLKMCSNKGSFTLEEDQTLMKFMLNQRFKSLGKLSNLMNRSRGQLRQRFKTLKQFLDKNPGASLASAPRRGMNNEESSRRFEFIKCIAEQYKSQQDIPTLEEIEEKLGVKYTVITKKQKNNTTYNVDCLLINFFSHSYKLKQKPIETTTLKIQEATEAVFDILTKWKVNLEIPEELQKDKKKHNLDIIDLEILNSLREKYNQHNIDTTSAVDDLIPPNMNTIISLRGLLLRNQLYKKTKNKKKVTLMDKLPLIRNKSDDQLASELIEMLKDISVNDRNQIENERCFFLERFISLFMWPAIFSIESPSEQLLDAELGIQNVRTIDKDSQERKNKTTKRTNEVLKTKHNKPVVKKIKLSVKDNKKQESKHVEQTATRSSLRIKKLNTLLKNPTAEVSESQNDTDDEVIPKRHQSTNINNSKAAPTVVSAVPENKKSANAQTQVKPRKIIRILKFNRKDGRQEIINELPPNLRKVEKSEVESMLKNKKPVKMFMIQKIKLKDGSYKTITKPYEGNKLPTSSNINTQDIGIDKNQNTNAQVKITSKPLIISRKINGSTTNIAKNELLGDNLNILDMISLANSVKKECNETSSSQLLVKKEPENVNESNTVNFTNLHNVLKCNVKQYHKRVSSKLSSSKLSNISQTNSVRSSCSNERVKILNIGSMLKDREDVDKLDNFLKNVEPDDGIIDLTEEEVTKNEVALLDKLIKRESKF